MKKIFLSVLLTLVASVAAIAQQTYVQGSPRAIKSLPTRSDPAVVNSEVDFEAIQYWVGEGSKKAALVMKWGDGKGGDTNLVWGYLFNSATGEQMLRDIAAADPRFYMLAFGETQYGAAIGGMGFDLNNDGNIALVNGDQRVDPVDGVCGTSEYDFDDWTAADPTDHWAAAGTMAIGATGPPTIPKSFLSSIAKWVPRAASWWTAVWTAGRLWPT